MKFWLIVITEVGRNKLKTKVENTGIGQYYFSQNLALFVGYLVLEMSALEDSLGEWYHLLKGVHDTNDTDWWKSGEQLIEAFNDLGIESSSNTILDEYSKLYDIRNTVVHGLWLDSSGNGNNTFLNLKINKKKKKKMVEPSFHLSSMTDENFESVIQDIKRLQNNVSDEISYFMGIKIKPT